MKNPRQGPDLRGHSLRQTLSFDFNNIQARLIASAQ
jgi:hypothetical protein